MSPKPLESWIQDLVYNVDVGIGMRLTKVILYILFVVFVAVLYTATQFRGLKEAEAMDYAQLGRNLAERGSFVTQYVRPASLWYLKSHRADKDPRIDNHPDILHGPVYPVILAAVFKLGGSPSQAQVEGVGVFAPEQYMILPLCHLFTILTGLLIYLIGRRLFELRVAVLAASVYLLSDQVWALSITGSSVPLAVLLSTAAFYAALGAAPAGDTPVPSRGVAVAVLLSGLFSALAFLTRYGTFVIVPGIALFLAILQRDRKGWAWGAGYLVLFLALISPWLLRNLAVSGGLLGLAPYTALNQSSFTEIDSFERLFDPNLRVGAVFHALQAKWMTNVPAIYHTSLRTLGDGLFICMFLTALFFRFSRRETQVLRWSAVLGLLLLVFIAGYFGESTARLLNIFLPFVLLYGSAFFFLLLDRLQLRIRILEIGVIAVMILVSLFPLVVRLLPPRESIPYPPYFPPYISHVSKLLKENELMCTDMPWATAWYGNRNSLLLPGTLDEFYAINDYLRPVSGIYFTTVTRNLPYIRTLATGSYRTWFPLFEGRIPPDFPLTEGFPINNLDQLFLTDKVRWGR